MAHFVSKLLTPIPDLFVAGVVPGDSFEPLLGSCSWQTYCRSNGSDLSRRVPPSSV